MFDPSAVGRAVCDGYRKPGLNAKVKTSFLLHTELISLYETK
jgi:hypothetical protein